MRTFRAFRRGRSAKLAPWWNARRGPSCLAMCLRTPTQSSAETEDHVSSRVKGVVTRSPTGTTSHS
eukprot:10252084-Alexandrium_andersonii.AAC.1